MGQFDSYLRYSLSRLSRLNDMAGNNSREKVGPDRSHCLFAAAPNILDIAVAIGAWAWIL